MCNNKKLAPVPNPTCTAQESTWALWREATVSTKSIAVPFHLPKIKTIPLFME